jgi:diguanylate cyclase (GGDEF)-like protein
MKRALLLRLYSISVSAVGAGCFLWAVHGMAGKNIDLGFLFLSLFTLIIASRMQIRVPRSNNVLSFTDAMVFLAFLQYGAEAAVLLATVETANASLRHEIVGTKNYKIVLLNFGLVSLSTTLTYAIVNALSHAFLPPQGSLSGSQLVSLLGIAALTQFSIQSIFLAGYFSLKKLESFFRVWARDVLPTSVTQIGGAGFAVLAYKLINGAESLAIIVMTVMIAIAYVVYRQTIREINESVDKAEQAERDKAQAERQRAELAEKHVEQLNKHLKDQEKVSHALRQSKEAFRRAAMRDSLTDLLNRGSLMERVKTLLETASRDEKNHFCILYVDLKRFKNINDTLGREYGDRVLVMVAKRLEGLIEEGQTLARLESDKFAILIPEVKSLKAVLRQVRSILGKISHPYTLLHGNKIYTTAYVGIALSNSDYESADDILRDADIAMHEARRKNIDYAFFDKELREKAMRTALLEADLKSSITKNELILHYQPIVSMKDGTLAGFEALVRWNHPTLGLIPPVEFIPIAEETGNIQPMTIWILNEACRQLSEWRRKLTASQDLMISVNLSGRHLSDINLIADVKKSIENAGISPSSLKLEITETTTMENVEQTIGTLNRLKGLGVQLSIDDFGTGYSSLSHLHKLPFDTLKIDRSFVWQVKKEGDEAQILKTIVGLAKSLQIKVIAEGVETKAQLSTLCDLDCEFGQGYLFSKPLPKEKINELFEGELPWLKEFKPAKMMPPPFITQPDGLRAF